MSTGIIIVFVTACTVYFYSRRRSRLPLPPGAPPKFFTGNSHQIPKQNAWERYTAWAEIYGSIISFRVPNQHYIVLNSLKSATELLHMRGATYSDRPRSWMSTVLAKRNLAPINISYSHPYFKGYRTMFKASLNPRTIQSYRSLQTVQSCVLLDALHKNPEEFDVHIKRNVAAVVFDLTYGWKVAQNDDYFIGIMEDAGRMHATLTQPGRWLVEVIPSLRFVPPWFPGAGFKRIALDFREKLSRVNTIPFNWAKQQIQSGSYTPSFVSQHLIPDDGSTVSAEQEEMIKWCSMSVCLGGIDTTTATTMSFILAMTLNPEVQKRAQAEIDVVVGTDRFPTFQDRDQLLYIGALIQEILRWAPAGPLGIPHRTMKEDIYEGYRIPEGAIVIANIFAMTCDADTYPDPLEFRPERFLGPSPQLDPRKIVFGFGPRACPGLYLSQESLYLNFCYILSAFTISKALDENGEEISPPMDLDGIGVIMGPKPFKCRFIPRNKELLTTVSQ